MRLSAVLILLLAVLAGCGGGGGDDDRPPSGPLPPQGKVFGFSSGTFTWTGREPGLDLGVTPEQTARDALAAGANSVRVPFSWGETEPQPGRLDRDYLALIDRLVRRLRRGGGRPLFFLGGPPPWASARPGDPAAPPRPDQERFFARFAAFVAQRYPDAVGIETWNEPNGVFGWRPRPDPAAYTRIHRLAARAIRAANPDVKVILGGLVAAKQDTAAVIRPSRYLKQMYAAGLRPTDYDALAFHPYPPQGGGKPDLGAGLDDLFADFREGHASRDPDAKVWITETGLSTTGPAAISADQQGDGIGPLVQDLFARPRVEAVYVHTLYEQTTQPASSPTRGLGLLTATGPGRSEPKAGYCALRRLARPSVDFAGCQ